MRPGYCAAMRCAVAASSAYDVEERIDRRIRPFGQRHAVARRPPVRSCAVPRSAPRANPPARPPAISPPPGAAIRPSGHRRAAGPAAARAWCRRATRSRGRNGNRPARWRHRRCPARFDAAQSSPARMPASGPAKSGTLSAITESPVSAKRAGSPLALRMRRTHCGRMRSIARDRMVIPPTLVIGLSPPPMRRARPPARMRPRVGGLLLIGPLEFASAAKPGPCPHRQCTGTRGAAPMSRARLKHQHVGSSHRRGAAVRWRRSRSAAPHPGWEIAPRITFKARRSVTA